MNEELERVEVETTKPYTTEVTRVYDKRIAPAGTIYLVLRYKSKDRKYSMCQHVHFGLEDKHEEIFDAMWSKLDAQYNLS